MRGRETIKLLEGGVMRNAQKAGDYLKSKLQDLSRKFLLIGDVRGVGLMIGIEIVKNRQTREPAAKLRDRIVEEAFQRGLLLLGCGESSIRFSPALVVTKREIDTAVEIFNEVLSF